jgi:hypothetical protein
MEETAITVDTVKEISFWFQLIFMVLGATLPILIYSLSKAGKFWEWYYFFYDNLTRWVVMFVIIVITQTILYFQGEDFLKALTLIGFLIPSISSAGVGVALAIFVVKTISTSPMIPPQNRNESND